METIFQHTISITFQTTFVLLCGMWSERSTTFECFPVDSPISLLSLNWLSGETHQFTACANSPSGKVAHILRILRFILSALSRFALISRLL